jgi:hypothetical protein
MLYWRENKRGHFLAEKEAFRLVGVRAPITPDAEENFKSVTA